MNVIGYNCFKEMEPENRIVFDRMENETWSKYPEPSFNKMSETSDSNISTQADVRVKVEIELKEEDNGLIYQPDFYGHLRLVSLNQNIPSNFNAIENITEWHSMQHPLPVSGMKEAIILPTEQVSNKVNNEYVYGQLKNIHDFTGEKEEESTTRSFQSVAPRSSEIYSYSFESTSQDQFPKSSQINQISKPIQKKRELSYVLAEKKRNYRMRIKEENPSMWCAMKQKEACKKREQREEKRLVLIEMQRMMQLASLPDSPLVENHKLYLETLKERFPEIWRQLIDALSAAEQRNQELINEKNPKRRLSKPVKMYKDVVEAQKKYLYRQRMKLERPDLYQQQKARDSYARSIRRMLKKKLSQTQNNINN